MKNCALTATLLAYLLLAPTAGSAEPEVLQVLLQGSSAEEISTLVENAGGAVTHDLHVINAVGAKLSQQQLDSVIKSPLVTRHIDDLDDIDKPVEKPDEEEGCKVRGHIELDFTAQGFLWRLYNKRTTPARLKSLELTWPPSMGAVTGISVGSSAVAPGLYQDASLGSLHADFPATQQPIIRGRSDLKISFESPTPESGEQPPRQRDFTLKLNFEDDCAATLVTGYENNHDNFYYNTVAEIDAFHQQGITGKGVTVAVIDSGLWDHEALEKDTTGKPRVLARYDARNGATGPGVVDESGHGTHMTSIIAHSGKTMHQGRPTGAYKGVAPDANLVSVKVLDRGGFAHILEIVSAIQWVVDNREKYNIRILNLSIAQTPRWPYWEDPVNQAVMKAWEDGIAVVAAAGNEGPEPMTIGSPGNQPEIITVGAVTDSWTPNTRDDDYIPDFSSRGPTLAGHVKPDIVALGGHMTGLIRPESDLAMEQPEDILRTGEFVSTGSSQATALVSGILALLIQLEPDLTPDELKCKLITSAEPAINRDGLLAYSPFAQGHGYLSAARAVTLGGKTCGDSNTATKTDRLEADDQYGPAVIDEDGNISLPGLISMVSATPSEKGLSENRKWGVKDHIERADLTPTGQDPSSRPPFDWPGLYLLEQAIIENLSREPPTDTPTPP
ncbi:MAG: S8 family peptidase [Halioglobus sp.]|nr:S8 family peptidase [Halioglobus sp.]